MKTKIVIYDEPKSGIDIGSFLNSIKNSLKELSNVYENPVFVVSFNGRKILVDKNKVILIKNKIL